MEYTTQENVYSEVYSLIEENRNKSYNPTFDLSIPIYKQNISKNATALICILHYNYWCTSEEEKNKIDKVLKYNTEKVKEKYTDYENMFNSNKTQLSQEKSNEDGSNKNKNTVALAVKNNDTIFKKILRFLKNIFRK